MSENEEFYKAWAETAKFGTKALDTTGKIGSFLSKVFKEPLEQVSGMIGDKLKYLRYERLLRLSEKVQKLLDERGITNYYAVPPKLALPILENSSLEEDDNLHDLWIKLLVNAMDPNFKLDIRIAYIEIIKSLSPLDVKILDFVYKQLVQDNVIEQEFIADHSIITINIVKGLGLDSSQYIVSIYNLYRLGCLTKGYRYKNVNQLGGGIKEFGHHDLVSMTPLGKNFVEACIK